MNNDYPLTNEEFKSIYSKVPRVCVDLIFRNEQGVYMTLRAKQPCKDMWHIPGGTVYFGETLDEAVARVAMRELGVTIKSAKRVGIIEYLSHLEHSFDHPITVVFEVMQHKGDFKTNEEASKDGWFKELPEKMHKDQDVFLVNHGYIS